MKQLFFILTFFIFADLNAQPLSGIYTIGGTTPNYPNFTTAIADLQTNGISGPVTFNIRNGTYTESLFLNIVTGSSATNTITFQSESGDSSLVILTYGTGANTFQMDSVSYITFRKMSIRHTGTTSQAALGSTFGSNIKVENCSLQGGSGGTAISVARADSVVYVENCRITNSNYGVHISDQLRPVLSFDIRVEGCNISAANPIWFTVLGSTIMRNNIITGTYTAIEFQSVMVDDLSYNTVKSPNGTAMQFITCSGAQGRLAHIRNNIFSVTNSPQPTAYGVQFEDFDRFEFINNTIYFNSPTYYHSAFYLNNADSCFIFNNIFRNNGAGYLYVIGAVYHFHSDHNVLSCNSGVFSSGVTSFSQFQSTHNTDSNSVSVNPQFVSAPTNLHTTNPVIDNIAIPWPTVPDDITGVSRHPQYPDPGVYEFSYAPLANLGPDQITCGNNIVLNAGNNGSYYLWNTGATSQSITATSSGTYWVRVNNLAGISSDTINVTIHPLPSIAISGNNSICSNDSTQLTVSSPAITFSWLPVAGLDNPNSNIVHASPSVNTTYTISVTDNFGCSNSDSITVIVHPLPIAQAGNDQSICLGSQTLIGTTSGMNCNWSPTAGLNLSTDCQPSASPISSTNYILTVTDINGCQNSDTVLVTVNPLPTISVCCPQTICVNDTVSLSATSSASNFTWLPAIGLSSSTGSTVDAFPGSTTTYTITATDVSGCQNRDSVQLTVNSLPSISVCCDQTLCPGDTVALVATSSSTNLSWSPFGELSSSSGTSVNAYPSSSTIFTVIVTDSNGCINSDSVLLTVNPSPNIPTITQNGPDLVSSEPIGNQWYLNGNLISGATNQTYTPVQNGNYTVVYTDANGCSAISTVYSFISLGLANGNVSNVSCYYSATDHQLWFANLPAAQYQVDVYDQLGQLILSDVFSVTGSSQSHSLNIASGIYVLVLHSSDNSYRWKLDVGVR